jgi:hypothetical protein
MISNISFTYRSIYSKKAMVYLFGLAFYIKLLLYILSSSYLLTYFLIVFLCHRLTWIVPTCMHTYQ